MQNIKPTSIFVSVEKYVERVIRNCAENRLVMANKNER